jgi:RNA polymerase sigma-70 factor (ECF subfamily)
MASISELIATAQSGDEAALEEIIRAYQQRVAAMVIARVGKDDDWQDLCQQIFVKMVLGLGRLKEIEAFEPWLFRIARNACFDHLRRRRNRWFLVPWQNWHDSIADAPQNLDPKGAALDVAIEQLASDQRELVTLVRDHNWGYSRLAAVTGQSVAAIKSRLFRARRRLRRLIIESGIEK